MIDEVGLFDPRFFLYFEETDLCYRARRAGWEIWAVGAAFGSHANAASAKATDSGLFGRHDTQALFRKPILLPH